MNDYERETLVKFKIKELNEADESVQNSSYYDYIVQALRSLNNYCKKIGSLGLWCKDCEFNDICVHNLHYNDNESSPYDWWD